MKSLCLLLLVYVTFIVAQVKAGYISMKTYSRGTSCGRNVCPIPYCKVSVRDVDGCSGNVEWASDCRLIRFGSGYSNKINSNCRININKNSHIIGVYTPGKVAYAEIKSCTYAKISSGVVVDGGCDVGSIYH
ncbi:hypothetical protein BCV72DRAFT_80254 [Rhizopus microsporus var. microsporus]|uniref:Kazal-like domain-containing protein n=2 Tax=Rhizopus microsporus TaxID=58291 RepID=A0A2G4T6C9_RHIZD|nr:uncharacterized protein RHIMIDRAFT_266368 [Rhizopus microsporus ATCC 52813]ORE01271.1 hypothetical protein BCV72DRAFT_80254 [Rhizopus microsporus var. microsporus]PHZ16572.1 hypothetical protein RHIMIDRAFT_266368 [Rhizopus microsporus ATCC 52813]